MSDGPDPSGRPVVERVRDMYTRYPYPPLGSNAGVALFGLLDHVHHVLWPGRPTLEGLRVLDAGCGTGHTTVQIALNHPAVDVVGIDISPTSLEQAEKRAREAGLTLGDRIRFSQTSIEELTREAPTREEPARAGQGPFDYIVASGVLHHMGDPVEGARRLASLLSPMGGIGIMLYAPHGRHGVYVLQDALRRLVGGRDLREQISVARQLLSGLPPQHPFKANQFADQDWDGDAGLVDLLLHVQDRSYSVPQVYELLDQSELRLERFLSPWSYRPENHVSHPALHEQLSTVGEREGAALAELLCGSMSRHSFFATRATYRPLRLTAAGMTLMQMRPRRSPLFRWEALRPDRARDSTRKPPSRAPRGGTLTERDVGPLTRTFELESWILQILDRCDGERTAQQIFELPEVLAAVAGTTPAAKLKRYGQIMELFGREEVLLFKI